MIIKKQYLIVPIIALTLVGCNKTEGNQEEEKIIIDVNQDEEEKDIEESKEKESIKEGDIVMDKEVIKETTETTHKFLDNLKEEGEISDYTITETAPRILTEDDSLITYPVNVQDGENLDEEINIVLEKNEDDEYEVINQSEINAILGIEEIETKEMP